MKKIFGKIKQLALIMLIFFSFTSCTSDQWTFKTDYFEITIDNMGYIVSMKNITTSECREFAKSQTKSPIMSLYNETSKEYFLPISADYDAIQGCFTLKYENGASAKVKLDVKERYFKWKLESLDKGEDIDQIQWGSYHTNINNLVGDLLGVARDTSESVNYSIGLLALDDNTLGGTPGIEGDAAPFQYMVHSPDTVKYPLPDSLYEGQIFTLGGDGISDVAFYSRKEPYFRITYGNAAVVDRKGEISLSYHSRNREKERQVFYSLIPNMPANIPNHIDVEPIKGVNYIGSSIAMWGAPDSIALMDVIQNIVLKENLPYPTIDGKWVKDPSAYTPDVVVTSNNYDSIASYAKQLGFKAIYANEKGFLRPDRGNDGYLDGKDYKNKPFHFSSGDLSHLEYSKILKKDGLLLGRVNITNSLANGTMDVSPRASDSLCYQQKRLLVEPISATDTTIIVDDPTYLEEIASWEGHCEELNMIKIGNELIHYLGVTDTKPYRLKAVKRGYWGTKAAEHQAQDTIYKLQVTIRYGYEGIIPNLALQDEIAKYYGDVAAKNGIGHYDFDGQEFLFNNGHGCYSVKRFFGLMFDRASDLSLNHIRFTGATLSEGSWHYQSVWNVGSGKNLYDVNKRVWGSTTSQGKDLRDVAYANFFPATFGSNFSVTDTSTVEQYEHIQAISVGVGATYYMSLNPESIESCPQKYEIFKAVRCWENARRADAFPRMLKKLLADPKYDWHLEEVKDGKSWVLFQFENGKKVNIHSLKPKNNN